MGQGGGNTGSSTGGGRTGDICDAAHACAAGFVCIERLSTSDTQGVEPFGFVDGISQPKVDWERKRPVRESR